MPVVAYDARRFDPDDRVFFNVTRRPSTDRCYFCHSFRQVGAGAPQAWHGDGDVHIRSGMACVDCHRNGIDHMITRGFENDPATRDQPEAQTLTCRGCHLGEDSFWHGPDGKGGRLGAPYPEHRGMPLVHFEKLTCTACHSGPWPEYTTRRFQTAMNHGLGLPTRERTDDDAPTIVAPVFGRDEAGKIAPHRMIWPAVWGVLKDETIAPLPLDAFEQVQAALAAPSAEPEAQAREAPATTPSQQTATTARINLSEVDIVAV
jgi:hypothetical protein